MSKISNRDKVVEMINSHYESNHLDFKEQYHPNNAKLLHSILCMANQVEDEDSYIVFGIKDKTFEIVGIENDANRKNQQNIIDFLGNVQFANDSRPKISLDVFTINNHCIDVLTIFHSQNVPFFLRKNYQMGKITIQKGVIYTRIGDTNTPIDSVADYQIIENL